MQIVDILKAAQQQNSSDIHIAPGNPVMLRIDGTLVPQGNQVLTNVETDNLLSPIVPQELKDELKEKGELDFAFRWRAFHESEPMCSDREVHMQQHFVFSHMMCLHRSSLAYHSRLSILPQR